MSLIAIALLVICQAVNTSSSLTAMSDSILALEERFKTALLERDAATIEALLADDLIHVGFEGQIVGRTEYLSFFKTGDWRYTKYSLSQVSVKALSTTAVVTGRVSRSIIVSGKETTGAFAFTHVWVQSGKTWRLTSSQVTTVPQQ